MNQLQVVEHKLVPFAYSEILAAKMSDGKIYAAVKWVCEGIGLTRDQIKNERKKVQEDLVLSKGGRNLTLPTNGGLQEVLCIELDFLPLWLAKISITPAMQETNPEAVENLVNYQLKVKDVLAEAFLSKVNFTTHQPTQAEIIAMIAQQGVEQERRLNAVEKRTAQLEAQQENITEVVSLNIDGWKNKVSAILNRIAIARGGGDQFRKVRSESYELLEKRGKCRLNIRLENLKKEAQARGICSPSKIRNFNKIDVIEVDTRLTEIYLAIVKEMAIAHKVNAEGLGA